MGWVIVVVVRVVIVIVMMAVGVVVMAALGVVMRHPTAMRTAISRVASDLAQKRRDGLGERREAS